MDKENIERYYGFVRTAVALLRAQIRTGHADDKTPLDHPSIIPFTSGLPLIHRR